MIHAVFARDYSAFSLSGHAGYAEAGADIICAAVSAMANLTCNAAEAFGAQAEVCETEQDARLSYQLQVPCPEAQKILAAFHQELQQLAMQYPKHIRVTEN